MYENKKREIQDELIRFQTQLFAFITIFLVVNCERVLYMQISRADFRDHNISSRSRKNHHYGKTVDTAHSNVLFKK